jgi:DNA-binding response OmpR family regulator
MLDERIDVVQKPFSPLELVQRVRARIASRAVELNASG